MAKPGLQKRFTIPKSLPVQYRHLGNIRQEWIDEKKRTVEFSFSSITPVERWYGFEILSHDPGAIDFRRFLSGAALLENHDWDKQIGVIEKAWVENSEKGYVRARFSKHEPRAEIVWGDVVDEIRRNVSVGYLPLEWAELIEDEEEENEIPTLLVLRWEPHEVSIVSVPADYSVGFGRDQNDQGELYEVRLVTGKTQQRKLRQTKSMTTRANSDPPVAPPTTPPEPAPGNGEGNGGEGGQHAAGGIVASALRIDERRRVNQMLSIGYRFSCVPEAERAIEENRPIGDFLNWVLTEKVGGPVSIQSGPAPMLGLSNKEAKSYSIVKAIREMSDINNGPRLTGLELEANIAMEKRLKRSPEKGFFLPPEVTRGTPEMRALIAERAVGVTLPPGTTGGQLVPTDFQLPLIDYLRNWLVVKQAGARLLTGLAGNLVIPKQTGGAAAEWLSEIGEVPESDVTFAQVPMQPRRLSTYVMYNRQLVIQSAPDIEGLVREDIGKAQAQRLDHTALFGTGVAPQPRGILAQVGINRFTFGSDPLYPVYVSAIVAIDDSKVSISSGAWIANPGCWGAGISTPRFEYTGITVITESGAAGGAMGGTLLGYPYLKTQQIPSTGANDGLVFFGNWSDLMIGSWDGTEVIVDPYTQARTAQIRVVILDFADVAVRYPEAFAVSTDNGYGGSSALRRRGPSGPEKEEKANGPGLGLGASKSK